MKTPKPPAAPEPKYIDRPEVNEVVADRLEHMFFDGGTLRMEFTVVRSEPTEDGASGRLVQPKQWAYTSARVVVTGRGVVQMLNKMRELQLLLERQGMIESRPAPRAESS